MIKILLFFVILALSLLIDAYITILFLRVIADWAHVFFPSFRPNGVLRIIIRVIYKLTEPPLKFLRRYIPPMNMGRISFDTAFIVLYFGLMLIRNIIHLI